MLDEDRIEAEKFIYAFTGMSISEYAEKILIEYNAEQNIQSSPSKCSGTV